jgi:hypothetical protein
MKEAPPPWMRDEVDWRAHRRALERAASGELGAWALMWSALALVVLVGARLNAPEWIVGAGIGYVLDFLWSLLFVAGVALRLGHDPGGRTAAHLLALLGVVYVMLVTSTLLRLDQFPLRRGDEWPAIGVFSATLALVAAYVGWRLRRDRSEAVDFDPDPAPRKGFPMWLAVAAAVFFVLLGIALRLL